MAIIRLDFGEFDGRALFGHDVPDAGPGFDEGQAFAGAEAHRHLSADFQVANFREKEASAAEGDRLAAVRLRPHGIIHWDANANSRILSSLGLIQLFACDYLRQLQPKVL